MHLAYTMHTRLHSSHQPTLALVQDLQYRLLPRSILPADAATLGGCHHCRALASLHMRQLSKAGAGHGRLAYRAHLSGHGIPAKGELPAVGAAGGEVQAAPAWGTGER